MAVTEGRLRVGTSDESLSTTKIKQTDGETAHREEVVIADPEVLAARQNVSPWPFSFRVKYAAEVTGPEIRVLVDLIGELLQEQRLTNLYLSRSIGEELTIEDIEDN